MSRYVINVLVVARATNRFVLGFEGYLLRNILSFEVPALPTWLTKTRILCTAGKATHGTEYILRVLAFRPFLQNPPKTRLEIVAYWESIGVVGSRSDITDSQEYARRLRNQAENRERA